MGGKWGLINTRGQWIVEPQFDEIWWYSDHEGRGVASVLTNGRRGLMDASGGWLLEPEFDDVLFESGRLARVRKNGRVGLITTTGRWIMEPLLEDVKIFVDRDLIGAKADGKWGYLDLEGQWIIQPRFDGVSGFGGPDLAPVRVGDLFGFVDLQGRLAIEPRFDYTACFDDQGLTWAKTSGKYGLIDSSGQWVIQPRFDSTVWPNSGHLRVFHVRTRPNSDAYRKEYVDANTAAYRTGLDYYPEEPGFRWEFCGGVRTLFNHRGEKILTVEWTGETETAKNAAGEIIWPQENPPAEEVPGEPENRGRRTAAQAVGNL